MKLLIKTKANNKHVQDTKRISALGRNTTDLAKRPKWWSLVFKLKQKNSVQKHQQLHNRGFHSDFVLKLWGNH